MRTFGSRFFVDNSFLHGQSVSRSQVAGVLAFAVLFLATPRPLPSATPESNASTATESTEAVDSTSQPELPTPGTRKMAERLAELAAKAAPSKTPSIAPIPKVDEYHQKMEHEKRPDQRVILRSFYAWHLMLAGRTEQALVEFEGVYTDLNLVKLPPEHSFYKNLRELNAITNLRYAEEQNCLANHSAESCIMPMRGGGIHTARRGGLKARQELLQLLTADPQNPRYRWLLNLTCMVLGEYPDGVPKQWLIPATAFKSSFDIGRFPEVAAGAGVNMLGLSGGVVIEDLDGDQRLDIVATDWGVDKQMRLFLSQPDGRFRDATEEAGLTGEVGGLNMIHADYDNDGHRDIMVLRGAWLQDAGEYPNSLLRNLGKARFDDVTLSAGLEEYAPCQSAAWADFDRDGLLDLFVGNETFKSKSYPCRLYHNLGDGKFEEIGEQAGLNFSAPVKGVAWGDVDNDGLPDLYVSCFGKDNRLFRNLGKTDAGWKFADITQQAGVAEPRGSFPTWFWDFDNDGWEDILVAPFSGFTFDGTALKIVVADYLGTRSTYDRVHLYQNQKNGTFIDVAPRTGFDKSLLVMGANFGDLDNDGFLDCYFGTGDPHFATLVPNRMFRNNEGKSFQDVTTSGGFGHVQKGHGVGFADLDNDGDQDIYAVLGGAIAGDIYWNALFQNPGHGNHWITLHLQGVRSNRDAIGARVRVRVIRASGESRDIHRTVGPTGSFGSSSMQLETGLGDAERIETVEIRWPMEGSVQQISGLELDRAYRIVEGQSNPEPVTMPGIQFPQAEEHGAAHE
jgi:hypothetical protein